MCTYRTSIIEIEASAKGPRGWIKTDRASIYFDHPVDAPALHTLNIDFMNLAKAPSDRVAIEMNPESARQLALAILETLEQDSLVELV